MQSLHVFLLVIYAAGMACGQLLFKQASQSLLLASEGNKFINLAFNPWFIAALFIYFSMTLLWVWILSVVPLSRAYPFTLLAQVIVPILGICLLGESVGWSYYVGAAFIAVGLLFMVR